MTPTGIEALERIAENARELGLDYEQPAQQEPFCWCIESVDSADWCFAATKKGVVINSLLMDEQCVKSEPFALYTTPPAQRQARSADTWVNATTWRGLTDEDINDLVKEFDGLPITLSYAIEAKLKELNT